MKYHVLRKLASDQEGLLKFDQLRSEFSEPAIRRMVDNGLLTPMRPSVYGLIGCKEDWRADLRAVLLATPDSVASHLTAMWFWKLFEDDELHTHLDVTVPRGKARQYRGVRFHETDRSERNRFVDGVPVTNPARTLIDSACLIPLRRLEDAVELALHLRITTLANLRGEVRRLSAHGRNGVGVMRELLDMHDIDDERNPSPFQREVRQALVAAGLPEPIKEQKVLIPGMPPRYIDLAFPEIRLGVECHSRKWHTRLTDFDKDALRDSELVEAGWEVIYVTKRNFEETIARIVRIHAQRPPAFD